jgi:FKBP-type peptidyl-prolyl cis-trans isomerase (trigger factor)
MEITAIEQIDDATLQIRGCIGVDELSSAVKDLREEYAENEAEGSFPEEELKHDALSVLLSDKIEEVLTERGLETVGLPEIVLNEVRPNAGVEFSVVLALYPMPEIVGYQKFEVSIEACVVTETKVSKVLSRMLAEYRREIGDPELEISDVVATLMVPSVNDLAELRQYIREQEEAKCEAIELEAVRTDVFRILTDRNDFSIPQQLIDEEIRGFVIADKRVDSSYAKGRRKFPVEEFREEYQERANERARLTVIIDRISEIEGIYAEEEEIEQAIEEIATLHGSTFEETHEYLMENGFILEVILAVTQEKVFEFLLEKTVIERRGMQH